MKKILFHLCFALFFPPTAWAQKNYETTYKLECGPTQVTITNTCTMLEDDDPYCSKQRLKFHNAQTNKVTEQLYLPKYFKTYGTQAFVAGLGCLKEKNKYFIITGSTFYANCSICVWNEIFDVYGKYLGSGWKGRTHALSKPFKKFQSSNIYYSIESDDRIFRTITFTRMPYNPNFHFPIPDKE
jgi:hypothetical protein